MTVDLLILEERIGDKATVIERIGTDRNVVYEMVATLRKVSPARPREKALLQLPGHWSLHASLSFASGNRSVAALTAYSFEI